MTIPIVASYEALAEEYYNVNLHPTCANFRHLSQRYLSDQLNGTSVGRHILEVGAGRSIAAEILAPYGALTDLTITDQSNGMLSHSQKWKTAGATLATADARHLPESLRGMTTVVASLADPYNDKEFWMSVQRVLISGGRILLTMPAFEWAASFRENSSFPIEQAEFITVEGRACAMPSLIPPLHQQVAMMELAGFTLLSYSALTLKDLEGCSISPKLRVATGVDTPLVWGFTALRK